MSITAQISPVKVQVSSPADRVGDAAAKAADIERRIDEEIADFMNTGTELPKKFSR